MDITSEILSPDYVAPWEICLLAEQAEAIFGYACLLLLYDAYLVHPAEIRPSLNAIKEAIESGNREALETILKQYCMKKEFDLVA